MMECDENIENEELTEDVDLDKTSGKMESFHKNFFNVNRKKTLRMLAKGNLTIKLDQDN